jgi:hypothetical protein
VVEQNEFNENGLIENYTIHEGSAHILQVFCPVSNIFGKGDIKNFKFQSLVVSFMQNGAVKAIFCLWCK